MSSNAVFYWNAGALLGASGIGLGAFGAHGLEKYVNHDITKIKNWEMSAHYQVINAVALLAITSISPNVRRVHPWAAPLILAGTTMFSGTIYLLTLKRDQFRFLGPVTPLGGLTMIAGWLALLL